MSTCKCPSYTGVPWSEMFPVLQMAAMSAPPNIMETALRQSAIEFLSRTGALERDVYIDLQEGVMDYQLHGPDGYRVNFVREVCADGLKLRSAPSIDCQYVNPGMYVFMPPDSLVLGSQPDEDLPDGLLVRASLQPSQDSCAIDDDIYQRYGEIIVEGALSRMLIIPNTPWFSTQSGGIALRRFKSGINRAKNDKGREYAGPRYMKAPRFV